MKELIKPENLKHTDKFYLKNFYSDAMNYLSFSAPVEVTGNFFVSYDISKLNLEDSLVVYMANRKSDNTNSLYLKNSIGWHTYNSQNIEGNGSALLVELIACNIDDTTNVGYIKVERYRGAFSIQIQFRAIQLYMSKQLIAIDNPEEIAVYDLLWQKTEMFHLHNQVLTWWA